MSGGRRRLLIVRPSLGEGGADRVTITLLRRLPRERFALALALLRSEGPLLDEVPPDVTVHSLGGRSLWSAWLPLARLLRRQRPDILFSTSGGANVVAVIGHRIAGRPGRLVLSERGLLREGLSRKKMLLVAVKKLLYRRADLVTAVSCGVRDELVTRLGLAPERISVVYNPVVDERLDALAREPPGAAFSDDGVPVILSAGRLVAEKDHATLIEAFARLRRRRRARLVLLGEGPLRPALEALASTAGVAADVELPGFVPNPFAHMSRATVFVLSSRFEGLPGVLIQAMACGAPVVSTDCPGGPAEIVRPEVDGILVPVGSPDRLAEAIDRLLDDPALRRRLAAAGRESARRFGVERVLPRYIEALDPPGGSG